MDHINKWDKGIVSGYKAAGAKMDSQYSWYGTKPDGTLVIGFEIDHEQSDYHHYDAKTGIGFKGFRSEDWLLRRYGTSSLGHYNRIKVALSSAYHMAKPVQILWIKGSRYSGDSEAKKTGPITKYNPEEWFIITKYDWKEDGELWVHFKRLDSR